MNYRRAGLVIIAFSGTAVLLLMIAVSFLFRACDELENPYSYYPSYEDAVKDGAVERGWIPKFIPGSAHNIHEQHDIDTNRTWIRFDTTDSDATLMLEGAKKLSRDDISVLNQRRPVMQGWWLDSSVRSSDTEIYRVPGVGSRRFIAYRHGNTIYLYAGGIPGRNNQLLNPLD